MFVGDGEVDLFLQRPVTITITIVEFIVVVINAVNIEEVDIGTNVLETTPLTIMEKVLMVMG